MKSLLPRTLRAVLCDMDGLLIDSEAAHKEAMRVTAKGLGYDLPEEVVLQTVGVHRAENRKTLYRCMGSSFPLDRFYECADALFGDVVSRGLPMRPGASELMQTLDQLPLKKAVVTSTASPMAEERLRSAGLLHRFDALVTLNKVGRPKPAPDPYLAALALLKVEAPEALALEDSHNGVRSATSAGLATIMVPDLLPATKETKSLVIATKTSLSEVADMLREHFRLRSVVY